MNNTHGEKCIAPAQGKRVFATDTFRLQPVEGFREIAPLWLSAVDIKLRFTGDRRHLELNECKNWERCLRRLATFHLFYLLAVGGMMVSNLLSNMQEVISSKTLPDILEDVFMGRLALYSKRFGYLYLQWVFNLLSMYNVKKSLRAATA